MKMRHAVALMGAAIMAMSMPVCAEEPVQAKVALITMDAIDVYWNGMKEGLEAKVAEYNEAGHEIEVKWMAPETKDNQLQIQMIEAATADGVDYIVVAANDATSCNKALEAAVDLGIKLIYVDSPATVEACATYGTNNYQGGVSAGEKMLEVLTEAGITEGEIGVIDAQAGVQSCQDRFDGFASVFEGTDFTIGERQYSEGDVAKAQELANTLIANGVVALYGTNNGATNGLAAAAADAASNGTKVYAVGWDTSDVNCNYVESGDLDAFMAQNPDVMGASAIDAIIAIENGEDFGGETFDTGVTVVTTENVADFK